MEIDPPDHTSLAENAYQDQTESDQPQMRQGENDYQEAQRLIDQTEIEISLEDNIDNQEVQRLSAKLIDGAMKTEFFFSSPCIYRVPEVLRKLNESPYTPCLIAIGPLHRNDTHLQTPMRHIKLSYANNLLCRLTIGEEDRELANQKKLMVLRECMAAMKTSLDDASKCYPEEVTLDMEMMLVDGCFILELLYRYGWGPVARDLRGADPIFTNSLTSVTVQRDLLLLENQIPYLVLERLFPLTLARLHKNLSLANCVSLPVVEYLMRPVEGQSTNSTGSAKTSCWPRDCVLWVLDKKMNNSKPQEKVPSEDSTNSGSAKTSCWPRDCIRWVSGNRMNDSKPQEEVSSRKPEEEVSSRNANYHYHILHKIHDDFLPHDQTGKGDLMHYMPSASELLYAGVKFVSSTGNDLFKVKFTEPEGPFRQFRSARFQIPAIRIQDSTEPYLRNFIAFEQCSPGISQHFISYAILMDMLVNSDIDVQVLEKAGIVDNWLGASEDVTNLFNKLGKGVIITEFLFSDACDRATRYRKHFWPKNMAYLRRQYFASPWKFIAFCLAFVYFGLTIAQFISSVVK